MSNVYLKLIILLTLSTFATCSKYTCYQYLDAITPIMKLKEETFQNNQSIQIEKILTDYKTQGLKDSRGSTRFIKDNELISYLNKFLSDREIPYIHQEEVKNELLSILNDPAHNWKSYKILFNKNGSNSVIFLTILMEHNFKRGHTDIIYYQTQTQIEAPLILRIDSLDNRNGEIHETNEIINKSGSISLEEITTLMNLYDVLSFKSYRPLFLPYDEDFVFFTKK